MSEELIKQLEEEARKLQDLPPISPPHRLSNDTSLIELLEEEARKLQETVLEEGEPEEEQEVVDINYEEVDDLYTVYNEKGEIIRVPEDQLHYYWNCEDGTKVYEDKVLNIDEYIYNPFTEEVIIDRFGNSYIEKYKRTWYNLLIFNEDGTYDLKNLVKISIDSIYSDITISYNGVYIDKNDLAKYNYEVKNGVLLKTKTIEEFKKDLFKEYPYFEDTINSIYGDNWDIGFHKVFNGFCVTIKFDEFTITNSKRQTHVIKDLYVLLPFIRTSDNKLQFANRMYGGRGIMSNVEMNYSNGYQHSHLNGTWDFINNFCLGVGPINGYILTFNRTPNEHNLFSVLYNIRIYVEWESIEGTPYRYIANLGKSEISPDKKININTQRTLLQYLQNYSLPLKIYSSNNINQIKIDENIVETELLKLDEYKRDDYAQGFKVYKDRTTGKYYEQGIVNYKEQKSQNILLTYKGENIYTQTYVVEKINIEDTDYVIHPSIKRQFVDYAIKRVRNYYFEKISGINRGEKFNYNI